MTLSTSSDRNLIGIIGAMKVEIDDVKSRVENPVTESFSGIDFVRGTISGVPVVVAMCGVGKVFAAMCAQTMILKYAPTLVINIGVGGSLSKNLNVGDIAIANALCQHDMDTSAVGDPIGLISGVNMVCFPCDKKVVKLFEQCAEKAGLHSETGIIASGDIFVNDSVKKRFIVDNFDAISCEMEGAAIAQVCYVNGVEFGVIRAISDNGDEEGGKTYANALEVASAAAMKMIYAFLES